MFLLDDIRCSHLTDAIGKCSSQSGSCEKTPQSSKSICISTDALRSVNNAIFGFFPALPDPIGRITLSGAENDSLECLMRHCPTNTRICQELTIGWRESSRGFPNV